MPRVEAAPDPSGAGTWTADHFRAYLLALAYNTREHDHTYLQHHFPQCIELSAAWHETFARMRVETAQDQHERWAMIGASQQKDRIFIAQHFVRPAEPYAGIRLGQAERVLIDAWRRGIPHWLGDAHTHPDFGPGQEWLGETFSISDFYWLLYPHYPLRRWSPRLMFLVGPCGMRAAFCSRESHTAPPALSQDAFVDFWLDGRDESERWAINLAIAERHRLVFYAGEPDQSLIRVFP